MQIEELYLLATHRVSSSVVSDLTNPVNSECLMLQFGRMSPNILRRFMVYKHFIVAAPVN